jgi:DNA-binding transcriptional LysR family regulator
MEIDTLKLFLDIARAGSFAKAARRDDVDPSLVSRRIAALEKELGFRLFQRTTRTISLTEAGAEFLRRVEPHLVAIDEARLASRDLVQQPVGLLRITASTTFGYEMLTPILPGFVEYAPSVQLELLLTDRRINLIEDGVDLAIRLGSLEESDLVSQRLMPVAFRIYASPEYLKKRGGFSSPANLNGLDCLTYPSGYYRGDVVAISSSGERFELNLSGPVTISSALSLRRCACNGMAPAFLPDWLVRNELQTGELIDPFPDFEFDAGDRDPAAWFVYPSRLYVPLKVRRFMEFVQAALARN